MAALEASVSASKARRKPATAKRNGRSTTRKSA